MTTPVVNNVLATTVLLCQFAATAEILARARTAPFAFFVAGFTALVIDLLAGRAFFVRWVSVFRRSQAPQTHREGEQCNAGSTKKFHGKSLLLNATIVVRKYASHAAWELLYRSFTGRFAAVHQPTASMVRTSRPSATIDPQ